jgi:hypothetical protein
MAKGPRPYRRARKLKISRTTHVTLTATLIEVPIEPIPTAACPLRPRTHRHHRPIFQRTPDIHDHQATHETSHPVTRSSLSWPEAHNTDIHSPTPNRTLISGLPHLRDVPSTVTPLRRRPDLRLTRARNMANMERRLATFAATANEVGSRFGVKFEEEERKERSKDSRSGEESEVGDRWAVAATRRITWRGKELGRAQGEEAEGAQKDGVTRSVEGQSNSRGGTDKTENETETETDAEGIRREIWASMGRSPSPGAMVDLERGLEVVDVVVRMVQNAERARRLIEWVDEVVKGQEDWNGEVRRAIEEARLVRSGLRDRWSCG